MLVLGNVSAVAPAMHEATRASRRAFTCERKRLMYDSRGRLTALCVVVVVAVGACWAPLPVDAERKVERVAGVSKTDFPPSGWLFRYSVAAERLRERERETERDRERERETRRVRERVCERLGRAS